MIGGIQDVYYSVTNSKRAIRFYTEALGMRLVNENEFWIVLDCNGVTVGLHPEKNPIPYISRDSFFSHSIFIKGRDYKTSWHPGILLAPLQANCVELAPARKTHS